jgi:uncharacterized protein
MERESFEDEEVASVLNKYFVSIKVDREERPDVDHVYMTVCQALTGQGGWPLTILMDPDKRPFFAGTYFPKHSKWGRPGLMELLMAVQEKWQNDRQAIVKNGEQVVAAVGQKVDRGTPGDLSLEVLDQAFNQLRQDFDARYGGFGTAPRFPSPQNLLFLLRYWHRTGNPLALKMVETTLTSMRQGGIYDHLGYGFARYSTDAKWLAPHFEKMLYDNALLTYAYLEGYQCTGNSDYARVAKEIMAYISRDMTDGEGGFYSAEDADSEGEEGKFYVWRRDEIIDILGRSDGELFCKFYDVKLEGNFEHATTILNHIGQTLDEFAARVGKNASELEASLEHSRQKLFEVREKRIHPYKDDKVLTAWNGLMIAAFAKAARVLQDDQYAQTAKKAVTFIYRKIVREDGRLLARYRDGEAAFPAYLEDHAYLVWGLVELYEATFELEYLAKALDLVEATIALFWDEEEGGFYFYGADGEMLISRPKELYDGAMPSGNSIAAWIILRLARMTANEDLDHLVQRMFAAFTGEVSRLPRAYTGFLLAVDLHFAPPKQIVIANEAGRGDTKAVISEIARHFLPHSAVLCNDPVSKGKVTELLPHIQGQRSIDAKTTVYICENFACQRPITELGNLKKALEHKVAVC